MDESLRHRVWQRAGDCCEYCQLPQSLTTLPHEVDHVVARKHDGLSTPENLCLACYLCNAYKGPNIAVLRINLPERLEHRRLLMAADLFPRPD